jgi:hypothetical protein
VSKGHTIFLSRSGCVNLIPVSKAIKTTSGPVGSCLSHSGVEKLPRPLRGWSGVECHPNYFEAGRTDYFSFRRQRSPRPLLGRWGSVYLILAWKATQTTFGPVGQKKKKQKKLWRLMGFEPIPLCTPSALSHLLFRPMTSRR